MNKLKLFGVVVAGVLAALLLYSGALKLWATYQSHADDHADDHRWIRAVRAEQQRQIQERERRPAPEAGK
jgi:hypothetical protein